MRHRVMSRLCHAAIVAASTAVVCWAIRREGERVATSVQAAPPQVDTETAAALGRIHLRLIQGSRR